MTGYLCLTIIGVSVVISLTIIDVVALLYPRGKN